MSLSTRFGARLATAICASVIATQTLAVEVNGSFSGQWFEGPAKSGRGFSIDVIGRPNASTQIAAFWFTYENDGSQKWYVATGEDDGSGLGTFAVDIFDAEGGRFDSDHTAIDASDVGDGVLTFASCNSATFAYTTPLGSDTINLVRLANTGNNICVVSMPADSCPAGTTAGTSDGQCVLSGNYENVELTLTNNITWILNGAVFIGGDNTSSSTLNIEAGTRVVGAGAADFLYISRGSRIYADGLPNNPIIMTGPQEQAPGEWAGLIMAGNAPVNGCLDGVALCEQLDEAFLTPYGGNDADDSSGRVRYTQIRFAGFEVRPNQEANCLTLLGVGRGTQLDHIQCHAGLDDGVEFFGGTVNLKNYVATAISDDNLDWGQGWTGNAQYGLILQAGDDGDHGIEADGNEDNFDSLPRSLPTIANYTFIGGAAGNEGARLRRGTGVRLFNTLWTGFGAECLNIDDAATFTNGGTPAVLTGELVIENSLVFCTKNFDDRAEDPYLVSDWFKAQPGNIEANPKLNGFVPAANSPLRDGGAPVNAHELGNDFFEPTHHIGGVANENDLWWEGWTDYLD